MLRAAERVYRGRKALERDHEQQREKHEFSETSDHGAQFKGGPGADQGVNG